MSDKYDIVSKDIYLPTQTWLVVIPRFLIEEI